MAQTESLMNFRSILIRFRLCVTSNICQASGKGQGFNVRKKAQTLGALIKDKDNIREVRQKAAANRDNDLNVTPFLLAPAEPDDTKTVSDGDLLGDKTVWALPYAEVLKHTVEEVVEGCIETEVSEAIADLDEDTKSSSTMYSRSESESSAPEVKRAVDTESVLEHQQREVQQKCKGVDGALAERQKSVREEELSCANIRRRRESLLAHFNDVRTEIGSEGSEIQRVGETEMEDEKELRILDKDLEFGEHILSRESARTEELRKEQQGLEEDLKKIEREITLRGMGAVRAEIWLAKLTDQVQLMAEGSGMGTTPLPIRNPRQPEQGRTMVVYLENCPVCGYNFKCLNASIADCGCVYHHFCLAAWLSDGRRQCAYRGCEKEFCSDWMASFGANQVRIPPLRQPKQEGLLGTLNRVESGNVGAAASTNFQVPSASGTPVSQGHQGPGTPSSGQLGTPASGSWRTPTGSVGRINAVGKSMQMEGVPSRSLGRTPKSGSRSNLGSGTGRTSDDSIVFGDDDVCLSQAPGASFPALEGVRGSVGETIIPETMAMTGDGVLASPEEPAPQTGIPNLVLSDDEDVDVPEPASERTLPDRAMGEGTEKDSSPASKGVLEWALPATEFQALDGDTVSAEIQAEPGSSPTVDKKTSQGARPHSTRRQAALHNKLCPSPTVTPGSTSDAGREPVTKKANLGRGRTIQGAARGEKGMNMKPLAQIGLQEKFRAPAVVSDGGKGRGRGGKVAKRKRD